MSKTIYLLNIDDYQPEITELTYPYIDFWATKIGAGVHVMKSRKFPDWPIDYEKLQIYDLAKQREDDWSIYLDSDTLIHPNTPDFTEMIPQDHVSHYMNDFAPYRFKYDDYFRRDGRHIGSASWFAMASSLCRDLWRPLDKSFEEVASNITPINLEKQTGMLADHLVCDYAMSHNIAEYGLHFITVKQLCENLRIPDQFFHHFYAISEEEKLEAIKYVINEWNSERIISPS